MIALPAWDFQSQIKIFTTEVRRRGEEEGKSRIKVNGSTG
jgi:hypothetical protein